MVIVIEAAALALHGWALGFVVKKVASPTRTTAESFSRRIDLSEYVARHPALLLVASFQDLVQ